MDGDVTCHYRNLSLLYARESEATIDAFERVAALPDIQLLMSGDAAYDRLFLQGDGRRQIRPIFAGKLLPSKEQSIRQDLRKAGLWFGR